MKLVKRVDLVITPLGKTEVTVSTTGNHKVYHTEVSKEYFTSFEDISQFIETYVLPDGFTLSRNRDIIKITNPARNYNFSFKIGLAPQGIIGYDLAGNQIFYYNWGAPLNTLSFFLKLHDLTENYFNEQLITDRLRAMFPFAKRIQKWDRRYREDQYIVNMRLPLFGDEEFDYVIALERGGTFKFLGEYREDPDTGYEWTEDEVDIRRKIATLQDRLRVYEFMKNAFSATPEDWQKKQEEEEMKRKEMNEYRKTLPRNPDLAQYHTKQLIDMLHCCNFYDTGFAEEDLRRELSHRPHVPNKLEAKKIRQERAKRGGHKSKNR